MSELYQQLNDAFKSVGVNMLSDDTCCKVLAYLYVMGGGNEAVVYNTKLNTDIKIAQDRMNLHGGEIPNEEVLPLLRQRIFELDTFQEDCVWLPHFLFRYGMKINKKETTTETKELVTELKEDTNESIDNEKSNEQNTQLSLF